MIDRTIRAERQKSPVGKACIHAPGQWAALLVYLDHGFVETDNNSVKNAIHPCALRKKNWMLIGDAGAGQRSAILYSLLGSQLPAPGHQPARLSALAFPAAADRHESHRSPPDSQRLRQAYRSRVEPNLPSRVSTEGPAEWEIRSPDRGMDQMLTLKLAER